MCLHVYVRPATIESFKANVQGAWTDDNKRARHSLSPGVRLILLGNTNTHRQTTYNVKRKNGCEEKWSLFFSVLGKS